MKQRCENCGRKGCEGLKNEQGCQKTCKKCLITFPVSEFRFQKNRHGNLNVYTYCKSCVAKQQFSYRSERLKIQTVEHFIQSLLTTCRIRAKKKGILFELTVNDILVKLVSQQFTCCYSSLPLTHKPGDNRFSIDRIDSSKGYTVENTVLTTGVLNSMKGAQTVENFVAMCGKVWLKHSSLEFLYSPLIKS